MSRVLVVAIIVSVCASVSASSPAGLSSYRDLSLGDSLETVAERLRAPASDVKVLHETPVLVQELTWRARPFISGTTVTADPLSEMVLTFYAGRLARLVATYDRERTTGLTDTDLIELLSEVYGAPLLRSTVGTTSSSTQLGQPPRQAISEWADAETTITLWREDYPRRIGLTVASVAADRALQAAFVDGARLASEQAPQRERDKAAAAAAALKERDAQIRRENRAKFKP